MTAWQRLRAEFDRPTALLYVAHRLLAAISSGRAAVIPYALYAQPLGPGGALDMVKDDASTEIGLRAPGQVEGFPPRPAAVLTARWASGSRCYAARVKGEFAGFIWVARGAHDEDEVHCSYRLPADGAWDYDVYLAPRWRLGRTLGRMWKAVDATLHAEGCRWSFSRISRFNSASIRAHERLGARCVGYATFIRLGQWQWAFINGRPRLGHAVIELKAP